MLTGSCLCGSIKYQLNQEDIDTLFVCHCSRCRKESGSAFNTSAVINSADITITEGKDLVKKYSVNGVNRHFCVGCGSRLYSSRDNDPAHYRLRVGLLDTPINPAKKIHVFTASKASWDEICDDFPQYPERPPV
ncbi:GFA family protein [Zophobihabitans entericus]|uniref:GFA family protein n=1 Tax=Zophobihabitans entericus TaxID=1635327 RepID=A0A6G9I959_9GAMM|nr:GFA family protein [Zophobihabitans entericus]QIQ20755.1 GFA family protein [Zophobihabitans entericus]